MYLDIIKAYWKEAFAYRAEYLFSIFIVPLRFAVIVMLWSAVYINVNHDLAGYTINNLITYFMISSLVFTFIYNTISQDLENEVKNGNFLIYMLKPISYIRLKFYKKISSRLLATLVEIIPILILFLIFFRKYFVLGNIPLFLISLILAFIISYFIYVIIGSLAFWFVNIRSFSWMATFFIGVASGGFFPIDLFPKTIQNMLHFVPFQQMIYIPTSIYLGSYTGSPYFLLLVQLIWCIVLSVVVTIFWKFSIKKFSGVGA